VPRYIRENKSIRPRKLEQTCFARDVTTRIGSSDSRSSRTNLAENAPLSPNLDERLPDLWADPDAFPLSLCVWILMYGLKEASDALEALARCGYLLDPQPEIPVDQHDLSTG